MYCIVIETLQDAGEPEAGAETGDQGVVLGRRRVVASRECESLLLATVFFKSTYASSLVQGDPTAQAPLRNYQYISGTCHC